MKNNHSKRLLSAMLGVAFSANLMISAGAAEAASSPSVLTDGQLGTAISTTVDPGAATTPSLTPPQSDLGSSESGAEGVPGSPQADAPSPAAPAVDTGDFVVEKKRGDDGQVDFKFQDGCLTFTHGGEYVVSLKPDVVPPTKHRIAVGKNFKGFITIDSLYVKVDDPTPVEKQEKPAIKVDGSAQLTLYLKGSNLLEAGADAAAIQFQEVTGEGYLTIEAAPDDKNGSLEARGGKSYKGSSTSQTGGAGIGGQFCKSTRNITIKSGKIMAAADADNGSAGIGGGEGADAQDITIEGGTVTAIGGVSTGGAGIGGGAAGVGKNITISGGLVTAIGTGGAGIGSGYAQKFSHSTIKITGGRVVAQSVQGDAIGGGLDNIHSNETEITIQNASVAASSEQKQSFSSAPKNQEGKVVHLVHLTGFNSFDSVAVDGTLCKDTIPAGQDQELHLYLTEGQRVSYDGRSYMTKYENDKLTLILEQDNNHSGGSSGGASVSKPQITQNPDGSTTETIQKNDGTIVKVTKKSDGSKTTVETKRDGTVSTTEQDKQGNVMETVKNPDGSSSTTEMRKDGTKVATKVDQKGNVSAEVKVPVDGQEITVAVPTRNHPAPGDVIVIVNADGTEKIVAKTISGENSLMFSTKKDVTVRVENRAKIFADVSAGHWAEDSVAFVSSRSLFNGINETVFAPNLGMTRGMLAVVLHNLESNPASGFSSSFTDVAEDAWYENAVQWAVQQGIVSGYGNGLFGADDQITREQLAVVLYRYSGSPSVSNEALDFADADQIGNYADSAMHWAVNKGILNGNGNGFLDPKGTASRAQVAVMLTRLMDSVAKGNQ